MCAESRTRCNALVDIGRPEKGTKILPDEVGRDLSQDIPKKIRWECSTQENPETLKATISKSPLPAHTNIPKPFG